MRPAARLALVLLPLVSLLACGGRFDGNVPGDGGSSSSSSGGGSGGSSGGSGSSSGGQGCPAPADVQNSLECSPNGLSCPTDQTIPGCNGGPAQTVSCVCENGSWFCDAPGPGCPTPVCPPLQNVVPNGGCNVPTNLTCESGTTYYDCSRAANVPLACTCNGGAWYCPQPPIVCAEDASAGCPSPASIQAGGACTQDPNAVCAGNPTQCNGQTDFDAFQCENGVWVDVAQTFCDVDAGLSD